MRYTVQSRIVQAGGILREGVTSTEYRKSCDDVGGDCFDAEKGISSFTPEVL